MPRAAAGRPRRTPKPEESEKRRFRGVDATTCPPPVQHPNHVASTCAVLRRRLMGRTLWQTAHRRIPTEPIRLRASPSCFRPPPLVPGLFWFRARVILLPDGPTCPIQRLPGRGKVSPFPHPEPPLLFSSCLFCPAVAAGQVRKNRMSLKLYPAWRDNAETLTGYSPPVVVARIAPYCVRLPPTAHPLLASMKKTLWRSATSCGTV